MSGAITPDKDLDTSGLLCPMPVVQARLAMDKLSAGQVLRISATDRGSWADIPGWARAAGHELLGQEQANGKYVFVVKKGSGRKA
jgi:TusA-related sulfurtransferase